MADRVLVPPPAPRPTQLEVSSTTHSPTSSNNPQKQLQQLDSNLKSKQTKPFDHLLYHQECLFARDGMGARTRHHTEPTILINTPTTTTTTTTPNYHSFIICTPIQCKQKESGLFFHNNNRSVCTNHNDITSLMGNRAA